MSAVANELCGDCGEPIGCDPESFGVCAACYLREQDTFASACVADECGRCDGTGEIDNGHHKQTCPVCRGSGLSSAGEGRLWKAEVHELGYSLDHLRILAGPICGHCYDNGELTPATERDAGQDWCANCHTAAEEDQHEAWCSDFYGGSGPQTLAEQMEVSGRLK